MNHRTQDGTEFRVKSPSKKSTNEMIRELQADDQSRAKGLETKAVTEQDAINAMATCEDAFSRLKDSMGEGDYETAWVASTDLIEGAQRLADALDELPSE